MGSKTFDGVWFISYSRDHHPAHIHGQCAGVAVIIDLLADGKIRQSRRRDAIQPGNAKRSQIRRILKVLRLMPPN